MSRQTLLSDDALQMIMRDQVALMPGHCVIQRYQGGSVGPMGGSISGSWSPAGTVACRVRPLIGQAAESISADRIITRENWLISVPPDAPLVSPADRILYLQPGTTNVTFEVKVIDNKKGEWNTVRRITAQIVEGGGGF